MWVSVWDARVSILFIGLSTVSPGVSWVQTMTWTQVLKCTHVYFNTLYSTVLYCIIYKYLYYCAVLYYTVLYFSSEKSKISSFYSQVLELKDIAKIGICLLLYIQLSTEDSTVWIVSPGKGRLVYKIIERLRPTSPYPGR